MSQGPLNQDQPHIISRNARYGLVLFILYSLIYAGFVALSVYSPGLMAKAVFSGVNLAVVYGLGLIVFALVLALIYMYLCRGGQQGGEQ